MSDIYKYINIKITNIKEAIEKSIREVKEELKDLNIERMCKVYTSYIYKKLKEQNVVASIVDTNAELDYSHYFIIVPNNHNSNYVIDLTYSQFNYNPLFDSIYTNGYQLLNNDELEEYKNNIQRSINRNR